MGFGRGSRTHGRASQRSSNTVQGHHLFFPAQAQAQVWQICPSWAPVMSSESLPSTSSDLGSWKFFSEYIRPFSLQTIGGELSTRQLVY